MVAFQIISLIIGLYIVASFIKAIKNKKYLDLVSLLLLLPFFLFFIISLILGGSAFNDAQSDYEYYQAGHYYLVSHGDYTEVTYYQYLFAMILEIVGLASLPISILWAIIRNLISMHGDSR